MKSTHYFFCLALLAACNSQPKAPQQPTETQTNAKPDSLVNCYQYAGPSDTITLKVAHAGKNLVGTLVYNLKEKDSNKGTIIGFMRDDILLADYTFMSEGVQSVRQVAFKQIGNSFVEGYGESMEENGKMTFKNVDSLNFSSSMKLQEIACQ
jgi:hypothetical protein